MSSTQPTTYRMLIGGERVAAEDDRLLDSIDPSTGDVWARVPDASAADVDRAVAAARAAFTGPAWAGLTATARGRLLLRLADLTDEHADELAAHRDARQRQAAARDERPGRTRWAAGSGSSAAWPTSSTAPCPRSTSPRC